ASIRALMTSRNRPSVRMMSGNVSIFVTGLTMALTTPNTSATARSVSESPVNVTPSTMCVAAHSAAAFTSRRKTNVMCADQISGSATLVVVAGGALHFDGTFGEHRGDRPDGGQHRREHGPDDADGQRKLHDGAVALLDDDAPHVAFVNQPLDRIHELAGGYLERFLVRTLSH